MGMYNFGTGRVICVPKNDSSGAAIAVPTPVLLGKLQDISLDISVDIKTLYGSERYPIAVGQGKGKIDVKAKYARLDGAVLGSLFFGKASAPNIKAAVFDSTSTITSSALTVVPPNSGTFVEDLGVLDAATLEPLKRVASAPVTGQYSVAAGAYAFASADADKQVLISYEYTVATGGNTWQINNEIMGTSPSFSLLLSSKYEGKTMVVKLNKCVSGKLSVPLKNDDFAIYDFDASAFADNSGAVGYISLF